MSKDIVPASVFWAVAFGAIYSAALGVICAVALILIFVALSGKTQ